ncbi:MAG: metallophosphoesterase family protein [Bacteroidales bacterium]
MKIGVLSDTHGVLGAELFQFFEDVDEIWHAGDIGSLELIQRLEDFKSLRAVYGNIDGEHFRRAFKPILSFDCAGLKVLMTHIGGYPQKYDTNIREILYAKRPQIFVCGHSHILKVMYDKHLECLHINPGAAGKYGFHTVRTAIRFEIQAGKPCKLEIGEWKK